MTAREPDDRIIVDLLHGGEAAVGEMKLLLRLVAAVALLCAGATFTVGSSSAQEIDFGKIDKFQSLGTGTLHVGDPPKSIIDDDERHAVILTIYDADAQTKVYWRGADGKEYSTNIYAGRGHQKLQQL